MPIHKTIRFPDQLFEAISKHAKTQGIDESKYIRNACEHFLSCKTKGHEVPGLRPILNKYRTHCSNTNCKKEIYVGEPCYWAKGIVICMDCMIQRGIGDKSLITKFFKMRKLQRLSKALKNECDRLANQIENLTISDKLEDLFKKAQETHKLGMEYLKNAVGTSKEQRALDQLIKCTEENMKIVNDTKVFIESKLKVKIKKKERA